MQQMQAVVRDVPLQLNQMMMDLSTGNIDVGVVDRESAAMRNEVRCGHSLIDGHDRGRDGGRWRGTSSALRALGTRWAVLPMTGTTLSWSPLWSLSSRDAHPLCRQDSPA